MGNFLVNMVSSYTSNLLAIKEPIKGKKAAE